MIVLKTAYDEALDHVSPGMLMREDEFRQVFDERQVTRIEFYGRVLEWHTRWTDEIRTLYHVNYYRWPLIRTLHTMRSSSQTDAPNTQGDKRSETLAQ